VLLTFDDWAYGDPYRATRIGAYLRSHNIRAAFFLINKYAQSYPGIVSTLRQQATGCSTTPTPPRPHDPVGRIGELAVRHGISSNRLRPPYGAYNSRVANIASGLGYRICTWTIDTRDWQKPDGAHYRSTSSIRSIVRTAPRSAKASGVVLATCSATTHRHFRHHLRPAPAGAAVVPQPRSGRRLAPFPIACT
jgi:peptidoglycan-N-acetylglucosamine deacetylase